MSDLDAFLSAPLEPVDDSGFSARVMKQVSQELAAARRRREVIEWSTLAVAAVFFLLAVPLPALNSAIEYVGTSVPIALAVMAFVLTTTYVRYIERT